MAKNNRIKSSEKKKTAQEIQEEIYEMEQQKYRQEEERKEAILKTIKFQPGIKLKNEKQKELIKKIHENEIIFVSGSAGTGKAQPLDSILYTPEGFKTMGEIQIGDLVITQDGSPTEVVGVFPQGKKEIFEIKFSDGSKTQCCKEHLWYTLSETERYKTKIGKVRSTEELLNSYITNNGRKKYTIPITSPVNFKYNPTNIHPYIMGALLGDGSLTIKTNFYSADQEIVKKIELLLPENISINKLKGDNYDYSITKESRNKRGENLITEEIKRVGLFGLKSDEKFIPHDYLYNSINNRIELLRGLMDTGGFVSKNGTNVEFYTTSKRLSNDVKTLVQSLGGVVYFREKKSKFRYKGELKKGKLCYVLTICMNPKINPFSLSRKKNKVIPKTKYKPTRHIVDIKSIGFKEAQCIMVDDESSLYLTDEFIVTHNTFISLKAALECLYQQSDKFKKILITKPIIEAGGESLGFLPGGIDSKIDPYMHSFESNFKDLIGPVQFKTLMESEIIKTVPLPYMRGNAQPLDSLVLTPSGYVKMGEIKIGDFVIDVNGNPTKVINIYPQGKKKIYKITFSDSSFVECCGEHLWITQTLNQVKNNNWSVKNTLSIKDSVLDKYNRKFHKIPIVKQPVKFNKQNVLINPYLLGLLLGDGGLYTKTSIKFTTKDTECIEYCNKNLPDGLKIEKVPNTLYDYKIVHKIGSGGNEIRTHLKDLGLLGLTSEFKFIPESYKINSEEVRLELLRGLLDTDGSCEKHHSGKSRVKFYSSSEKLVDDVIFIVQSLGGVAHKTIKKIKGKTTKALGKTINCNHDCYKLDINLPEGINPFRFSIKSNKFTKTPKLIRMISKIEEIGEKESQCIEVESPEHLYLTNSFIVTHNTFKNCIAILDEAQNTTPKGMKLFISRKGGTAKLIILGDTDQSDLELRKGEISGLQDAFSRFKDIPKVAFVEFTEDDIVRDDLLIHVMKRYKGQENK
jgi:phosphate starvation-inducible PhoH-like protein